MEKYTLKNQKNTDKKVCRRCWLLHPRFVFGGWLVKLLSQFHLLIFSSTLDCGQGWPFISPWNQSITVRQLRDDPSDLSPINPRICCPGADGFFSSFVPSRMTKARCIDCFVDCKLTGSCLSLRMMTGLWLSLLRYCSGNHLASQVPQPTRGLENMRVSQFLHRSKHLTMDLNIWDLETANSAQDSQWERSPLWCQGNQFLKSRNYWNSTNYNHNNNNRGELPTGIVACSQVRSAQGMTQIWARCWADLTQICGRGR